MAKTQNTSKKTKKTCFSVDRAKMNGELEKSDFVEKLLAPLEEDVSKITLESLHETHAKLCECDLHDGHPHRRRFHSVVKQRAEYIASQWWLLDKLNEAIEELRHLQKLLPKSEHASINREIDLIEATRKSLIDGAKSGQKIFDKKHPSDSLIKKLQKIVRK